MSNRDKAGRRITTETPIKICDEFWSEFILIAQFIHRLHPEAEIADVFEWFRQEDLGGTEYSPALLKRVDREIATDLRYEIAS